MYNFNAYKRIFLNFILIIDYQKRNIYGHLKKNSAQNGVRTVGERSVNSKFNNGTKTLGNGTITEKKLLLFIELLRIY